MGDRTKLALTGVVALAAVGMALGSRGHGISFSIGDDDDPPSVTALADLRDFDGVTLNGPDHVVVTRGDKFAVTTSGSADALKHLKVVVRDHMLFVEREHHGGWFGGNNWGKGATVNVTLPALTRLALTGSGELSAEGLAGKQVRAQLTGPGDLRIKGIDADEAEISIVGSGDLSAQGRARTAKLEIKGSGGLRAGDLNAETVTATLSGSGDIAGHASRAAKIAVNGSGDVHVEGTNSCSISKQGSGDAECSS